MSVRKAAPRCTGCNATGHNLRTCPKRLLVTEARRLAVLVQLRAGVKR